MSKRVKEIVLKRLLCYNNPDEERVCNYLKKKRFRLIMFKRKFTLSYLSFFLLLIVPFFSSVVFAEDYKIGVVNLESVATSIPQTEAAKKKLEKEFASRDREIGKDDKELQALGERLQKDGAIMSESERTRIQRELTNKQRDLKRKAQEFQEDLEFRRREEMQEIQKKIAANVRDYAKEHNFDFVLVNSAVYFSKRVNITEKIIERMNKVSN